MILSIIQTKKANTLCEKLFLRILTCLLVFPAFFFAADQNNGKETQVTIVTSEGIIRIKLYNETPLHRDNFIKLVKSHYYDSTLFHRVINEFMIQGGDPDSKLAVAGVQLGNGGPGYTLPAEFMPEKLYHKKGALAAARNSDDVNPEKASSGSQFYIVQGKKFTDADLNTMEERKQQQKKQELFFVVLNKPENLPMKLKFFAFRQQQQTDSLMAIVHILEPQVLTELGKIPPFHYSAEQRLTYSTIGGTPHLDGNYTVFGEVIEGLDIVDKIGSSKTLPGDRPEKDIRILRMLIE